MYHLPYRSYANTISAILAVCTIVAAIAVTVTLPTVAHAAGKSTQTPMIIGGEEASESFSWMVALVKTEATPVLSRQFCGGALIAPEWVLTAAHCTYHGGEERATNTFNILVGTTNLHSGAGDEIPIIDVIRHPHYDGRTNDNDVALLRLARSAPHPTIGIGNVALLDGQANAQLMTLGWGRTEDKKRSESLLQVNVPLVEAGICQSAYAAFGYAILENMICAGYAQGGKDACVGDSGGPLIAPAAIDATGQIQEWVLVGVVSWGVGCAQQNAYGVYADVGYFIDWVVEQIESRSSAKVIWGAQLGKSKIYLPLVQ